jgi:5-methylcytosine-specific restriction endonuclease McrA
MGKCKLCVKNSVRENRRNRVQQYAEYERSRSNLPHRVEARIKYQEEHKEQISLYKKNWAAINYASVARSKRNHYECNREEVISRSKKWAEDNTEKAKAAKANNRRKRRAAKNVSNGHFTAEEFDALCSVYGYACLCCGVTTRRLEADHVVPLTQGGSDDISNIQPLCGMCNRRKFTAVIDYRLQVAVQSV